jgi:hypothetical protein
MLSDVLRDWLSSDGLGLVHPAKVGPPANTAASSRFN